MNLIYKITFLTRELNNEFPCYYIGSKVDATFDGTNILDKKGKIYTGSVTSNYTTLYKALISDSLYRVDIIGETMSDPRCIENHLQMAVKAVTNEKYFNKTYAHSKSRYDAPGYAPYKHVTTGKIVKLKLDEVDDNYVGIRKGCTITSEHREIIKQFQKEYWTPEKKQEQSYQVKKLFSDVNYALKFKSIMNQSHVKQKISESKKIYWSNVDNRKRASDNARVRNNSPLFKDKFRKSRSRGTWIQYEKELKTLWYALGKPGYITFRKRAIEHGFNDENYQGAVRSWSNYYANRN